MQQLKEKTKRQIVDLFKFIALKEMEVERKREALARMPDFEPVAAFKRIVRTGDLISYSDIFRFLQ